MTDREYIIRAISIFIGFLLILFIENYSFMLLVFGFLLLNILAKVMDKND